VKLGARWEQVLAPSGMRAARFAALGTTIQVVTFPETGLERAMPAVEAEVFALDVLASRFRSDAELVWVNQNAGRRLDVSPRFAELLSAALLWADRTDGLVDPTVGRALVAAGYRSDFERMDKDQAGPTERSLPAPGWHTVRLDGNSVECPPGLALDLGATAKGWGADRAALAGAQAGQCSILVSLGGDIATAGPKPPGGWVVRVSDDHRGPESAPGQTVVLSAAGLATSSTTVRRWRQAGQVAHHLIDPRTGRPAAGPWRTVSVAASSCLEANALSTAALVAGSAAVSVIHSFGASARLVSNSSGVRHLGAWTAVGEELAPIAVITSSS